MPKMEKTAKKFLEGIKWHGVVEIDFRMDNAPYIIEVNPRFWGGLNQAVASNVNYPIMAYQIAVEGDCLTTKKINTIRTENLATSMLALIDELQNNEEKQREIIKLHKYWKKSFSSRKDFEKTIKLFLKQVNHYNKKKYTLHILQEYIKLQKNVRHDVFGNKDPFVFMGILYPIHLMLKYGKVDKYMLTDEAIFSSKKQPKK